MTMLTFTGSGQISNTKQDWSHKSYRKGGMKVNLEVEVDCVLASSLATNHLLV